MSILEKAFTGIRPMPRRLMIYGQAGIGKSRFAADAPNHIIIQTEDGSNDIKSATRLPVARDYETVINTLIELYQKDHPYKTVVIDTLDWLENLIYKQVCKDKNVKNIAEIGYGKAPDFAMDYWRDVIRGLNALREKKEMGIILIAHCMVKTYNDPETENYDRYIPKIHERSSDLIREWCDEVFFATTKVYTKEVDLGFNKKKHKALESKTRILKTCEMPTNIAKQHLEFPDEIELAYHVYDSIVKQQLHKNSGQAMPSGQGSPSAQPQGSVA